MNCLERIPILNIWHNWASGTTEILDISVDVSVELGWLVRWSLVQLIGSILGWNGISDESAAGAGKHCHVSIEVIKLSAVLWGLRATLRGDVDNPEKICRYHASTRNSTHVQVYSAFWHTAYAPILHVSRISGLKILLRTLFLMMSSFPSGDQFLMPLSVRNSVEHILMFIRAYICTLALC